MTKTQDPTREAVGVFHDVNALESAVSALASAGFDRSAMSLLAQEGALDGHPPKSFHRTRGAADDPAIQRDTVVSDTDMRQGRTLVTSLAGVIAAFAASGITILTGGAALAAIAAAAAAGGGAAAIAEAVGQRAGSSRADFMREQIDRGGVLLWVTVDGPDEERHACEVLRRHSATDVHVHDFPVQAPEGGG